MRKNLTKSIVFSPSAVELDGSEIEFELNILPSLNQKAESRNSSYAEQTKIIETMIQNWTNRVFQEFAQNSQIESY